MKNGLNSVIYLLITVNKYWFCISVIGYINVQIIGIGYKKINIGRSLILFALFYKSTLFRCYCECTQIYVESLQI